MFEDAEIRTYPVCSWEITNRFGYTAMPWRSSNGLVLSMAVLVTKVLSQGVTPVLVSEGLGSFKHMFLSPVSSNGTWHMASLIRLMMLVVTPLRGVSRRRGQGSSRVFRTRSHLLMTMQLSRANVEWGACSSILTPEEIYHVLEAQTTSE